MAEIHLPERMEIISWLYGRLGEHRFLHTLGVEQLAVRLASMYGEDIQMTSAAALMHDCAKPLSADELLRYMKNERIPMDRISEYPAVWHAFAAPDAAQERWGKLPDAVLDAICYHTTGRPGMSRLEKIIFCADFAEPTRSGFPELEPARQKLESSLDEACIYILDATNRWLKECGKTVCPLSEQTLRALKNRKEINDGEES